ncbi:hypothetical protein RYX36_024874 [Vicia faba]
MSENVEATIFRVYVPHIPKPENNFKSESEESEEKEDCILSFATEHYDEYGKGNGVFKQTWETDSQSIEWVKNIKKDYADTRVVISIGGFSSEFPFNPIEKNVWIDNAVKSINQIIDLYGTPKNIIDGIDIHYEAIYSSEDDFSFCIGKVIRQLKQLSSIKLVSIAPSKPLQPYYHKLYLDNKDIIDYVDYGFSKQSFSTKEKVVELYKELAHNYAPALVLPEINIYCDPVLSDGIGELFDLELLPGIVFWGFPISSKAPKTFSLQKFLLNLRSNTTS